MSTIKKARVSLIKKKNRSVLEETRASVATPWSNKVEEKTPSEEE